MNLTRRCPEVSCGKDLISGSVQGSNRALPLRQRGDGRDQLSGVDGGERRSFRRSLSSPPIGACLKSGRPHQTLVMTLARGLLRLKLPEKPALRVTKSMARLSINVADPRCASL